MHLRFWAVLHGAVARMWARLHPGPDHPEQHGDRTQTEKRSGSNGQEPAPDVLRAEWAAFQALIREIHESEKQHQTAERNLGTAQHRTAKGLNRITAIGAIVGIVGAIGVIGSLVIAKRTADDAS